jgi:hypothetical protein
MGRIQGVFIAPHPLNPFNPWLWIFPIPVFEALDPDLKKRETILKEKLCRNANWERATWKFQPSGWDAWE